MAYKDKEAEKAAKDRWYRANKNAQLERQAHRQLSLLVWLRELKRTLSCLDCGMSFKDRPECLDFHHLDPSTKEGTPGKFSSYGKKRMLTEINKCVPLCANCHRTRHTVD